MKSLMYAMIIALTTYVPGQAMPYDSTATKEKKAITIYANRIVQYGKNGFAFAKNISPEVSASIVSAYDKTNPRNPGWNMSIDWMHLNPLWAPNLVTEFSFTTTRIDKGQTNKNPGYFGFHYTLNHNPIFVRLAKQNIPLIHINHRWDSAEIGFRTWSFDGFSSQNNTLQSNPTIVSDDSTITTANTQGAIMFGYALSPVKNELTPSGLSEVVWWASNRVNLQTKEVYIAKPLTQSLDIQIGYKYVNIENNQRVGQTQRAYETFYENWWFDNQITIDLLSGTEYKAKGPAVGLRFSNKFFKVFLVDMLISYSRLTGKAHWLAQWIDIDDIKIPYKPTGQLSYEALLSGDYPYNVSKQEPASALTAHIKLNSPDFDPIKPVTAMFSLLSRLTRFDKTVSGALNTTAIFTKRFENNVSMRLNAGWFESSFEKIPVAAHFVSPNWTHDGPTHWERNKQNLGFNGVSVGVMLNL